MNNIYSTVIMKLNAMLSRPSSSSCFFQVDHWEKMRMLHTHLLLSFKARYFLDSISIYDAGRHLALQHQQEKRKKILIAIFL